MSAASHPSLGAAFAGADPSVWEAVQDVVRRLTAAGGKVHLVGGCVRDALLGEPIGDFDLEVFRLPPDRLRAALGDAFAFDVVGAAFGVLKLEGLPVDVALPRVESKSGPGHRGFEVRSDPWLSFAEAAARRDFTINSIAWEPLSGELIDPFDGAGDLGRRLLRHTSERFGDDPLRVLRGMQLIARFELSPAAQTVRVCRTMSAAELAPERIFEEWRKLLLRGRVPSLGLRFLRQCGWLREAPELEALIGVPQDPSWHPEGDVWVHTLAVLDDYAGRRLGEPWEDLVVGLACLCHDLGKPRSTEYVEGRWRSRGHEEGGAAPTRTFLERMTRQGALVDQVLPLVVHHLKPRQLYQAGAGDAAVRRLARKVGRIDRLVRVARADEAGRGAGSEGEGPGAWLLERAQALALADRAPRPLIMGRHLVERGLEPGPAFAPILEACFEAQLDGAFADVAGGLRHLDRLLTAAPRETGGCARPSHR
ncbi:MAG TPA: HD domain-containing protein [Thermoanaerobaculia bacterium]|nr:HD domain-containing protein [Thermoanaerobaculia bacterium]